MPPPTAVDPWIADRRFAIVIDAGSSGSRSQIYSWKNPRTIALDADQSLSHTLPKVEKGVREGQQWISKVEPGLSSFADDPESAGLYLVPLLHHAREHIPPSLHKETPLFLLATAGMRLLAPLKQAAVLRSACHFLKFHSDFRIDEPSNDGPCGSNVRIITGEEEGLFGWIAVNYLMDGFTGSSADRTTYGFLDMGGASTQIAFEPKQADRSLAKNLIDIRLRLLGGDEIHHQVFVTTWLGYGTNQARERYVGQAVDNFEKNRPSGDHHMTSDEPDVVPDPCLPKDLERREVSIGAMPFTSHNSKAHILRGTGSFEQCLRRTSSLLNKDAPCPDSPCLFNGVHVPPIDFSVSHFIGVSEYWYSSEHVFGLGGPYDFVQYERAASEFCSQNWSGIVKQHEESRQHGRLGGDGEVVEGGAVVQTGKWGPEVEISRLEMQCFKAAWIANVLHEGIGLPRIVDPGGNLTTDGDKVAQQAERKGLGRPTFQSVDTVGDIAISWTLGKMVLEASKDVPPSTNAAQPLGDPLDGISEAIDAPVHPIRPPFFDLDAIEDHISQHLPASLSRTSLGFSPLLFIPYASLLFFLLFMICRTRHYLGTLFRRVSRAPNRRARDLVADGFLMEEGQVSNPPRRKWPNPLRSLFQPSSRTRPQALTTPSDLKLSTRNQRYPHLSTLQTSGYATSHSRSPSPVPPEDNPMSMSQNSLLSSRSRNASQHSLVPRQSGTVRTNGPIQTSPGGSFRDQWP